MTTELNGLHAHEGDVPTAQAQYLESVHTVSSMETDSLLVASDSSGHQTIGMSPQAQDVRSHVRTDTEITFCDSGGRRRR